MSIHDTWDEISEDEINESKYKERASDEYPDGLYTWKVVKFDYFAAKDGREYHKWGLEVADGIMAGKYTEDFGGDNRVGIKILKEKLYLLTGRIPTVDEVYDTEDNRAGTIKNEVLGKVVSGRKVTKRQDGKSYVSCYFNSVAEQGYQGGYEPPPPSDDDAPIQGNDEDIPF